MKRIGITGATGFIGLALTKRWAARADIVPIVRNPQSDLTAAIAIGDINGETNWTPAVSGLDVIVHCAGRAHVLKEQEVDPLEAFRVVNVEATTKLAEDAIAAGVRRLVFLSSVGVMGDPQDRDGLLRLTDSPLPTNAYSVSKLEAEKALRRVEASSDLEVVIVRPPLVYGPGAPANFQRFVNILGKGIPLPLGRVSALRSFVGIENLSEFLWLCTSARAAAGRTFFVSDGDDLSTADLARLIAKHLGVPARLLPVPPSWLRMAGKLVGRTGDVERLLSNLRVDLSANMQILGWQPAHSTEDQITNALLKP
ncbi:NAD-dependent epimerase/dehydratase family protein [Parasphingorhabdus sp.]|uniref:NAD-dependent epimerase/dehydratase family protein n=1 Tax=Parasphingorhabdus sp. TaxID=2709688 RepID=UPI003264C182